MDGHLQNLHNYHAIYIIAKCGWTRIRALLHFTNESTFVEFADNLYEYCKISHFNYSVTIIKTDSLQIAYKKSKCNKFIRKCFS